MSGLLLLSVSRIALVAASGGIITHSFNGATGVQAGYVSPYTFTNRTFGTGRHVVTVASRERVVTAVSILGVAATQIAQQGQAGTNHLSIWEVAEGIAGTGNVVLTAPGGIGDIAISTHTLANAGVVASTAVKESAFNAQPHVTTSPLTVPTGGVGLAIIRASNSTATFSWNTGVELAEVPVGSSHAFSVARFDATATPSVNGASSIGTAMLAAAWNPGPLTLLGHTDRFTVAGNSYMAQTGNIDLTQWTWIGMGCRGMPTNGTRQSAGGERIDHLIGRLAPIQSVKPSFVDVMNIENDLGQVANTDAGGDTIFANLQTFIAGVRSSNPQARFNIAKLANTNGRANKAIAAARYDTKIAELALSDNLVSIHDEALNFDAQNVAQSSDGTHPNKRLSARALGLAKGAIAATRFNPADLFDGGLQLTNAINKTANAGSTVFNSATAWTLNANSSGLSIAGAAGFLADRPTVPSRNFTWSGTCAADETLSTSVPDATATLNFNFPTGHSTHGKHYAVVCLVEITNAAGNGPPVNVSTVQIQYGSAANVFSKTVVIAQASDFVEVFKGPIGLLPLAALTVQTGFVAMVVLARGKNGLPIDLQVRIAAINIIETEATEYGVPAFLAKIYNVGRPVIGTLPTQTPTTAYNVGDPVNILQAGTCVGGGLTRTYQVVNELNVVVGTCTPALNGVAAVPYIVQAGDVGAGKTLRVRSNASNSFGSDFLDTTTRASV